MENKIPKTGTKRRLNPLRYCIRHSGDASDSADLNRPDSMWDVQKRYVCLALILAILLGVPLILIGQHPLGKGVILGTLFGIANFILMALALPMRLRYVRGKALLCALTSLYVRFALMALPLIWALKHDAVALATTAAGLFMVQIAIIGDHLWTKLRDSMES